MQFVDRVEIYVKGGDGGNGCLSFRREKFVPRGGPDGGDGGHGGHIIVRAIPGTNSLAGLSKKRHWLAENGRAGQGKKKTGRKGEDLVIEVPPGTQIRDREHGFVLKDLTDPHSEVIVARGGKGGKGNTAFATATNQTPRQFEKGQPGEERSIVLELKLIADVGLIGLPNAGKSTLLSRLSKAHPEIADYPFTTKYPNLGLCRVDIDREFVIADIPGLIEGAHEGVGLGHEFLRHVERTRLLLHLVECQPTGDATPFENFQTIRHELSEYSPKLAARREIVILTKTDLGNADEIEREFTDQLGRPVVRISAVTGEGLKQLVEKAAAELVAMEEEDPPSTTEPSSG
ncbi:GTPase Obg [Planctomycetes bacterium Pan216]|uniref:GTPase Obg n=1 Tax=Kolteria novifilia TaxID=2527975 RepID=A0A518B678_9BACT|nr:GTPase Obg [Planctomycetes bacterium Pan216]